MVAWAGLAAVPANFALGLFLCLLAAAVARRLRLPGRGWLAAFLALVGSNYAIDVVVRELSLGAHGRLATVASLLDPAALLLFAAALWAPGGLRRRTQALVALPCLFLAGYALATYSRGYSDLRQLALLSAWVFVPYYLLALALVARAHHASASEAERELRGHLFVALAVVVLSRIPLLATDLGVVTGGTRGALSSILWLDVPLVMISAVALGSFVLLAPPAARRSARRLALLAAALLALVESVWALRFVPLLETSSFGFLYSIRWFVFAGLVVFDLRRFEILGIPARIGGGLRVSFGLLLALFVFLQAASLFAQVLGDFSRAFVVAAGATLPLAIVAALLLRRLRRPDESTHRRLRIYRAHAELRTSAEELDRLRRDLGLTSDEAREEERLMGLEAQAPAGGLDRPRPGDVFARRYEVGAVIGGGTFGLVYDAFDRTGRRRVVLKEVRPSWRHKPEFATQVLEEARILLRVSDPHLVRFVALERAGEGHVLVLEHVEGETLRERMARGPLSGAEASAIAAGVLQALSVLHREGILHRDVKPENIVLHPQAGAVLLDLGSALPAGSGTKPAATVHPGTPGYMSPEALRGARLSPASDLYALGVVLREALGPEPPAEWAPVLSRATAPDPDARFATAEAFRAALPPARA